MNVSTLCFSCNVFLMLKLLNHCLAYQVLTICVHEEPLIAGFQVMLCLKICTMTHLQHVYQMKAHSNVRNQRVVSVYPQIYFGQSIAGNNISISSKATIRKAIKAEYKFEDWKPRIFTSLKRNNQLQISAQKIYLYSRLWFKSKMKSIQDECVCMMYVSWPS